MIELRLAGVHDDGENLVLQTADGTSYLLPIDQNLRTSIAKARRIQPLRGIGGSAVFGPRDIQTRFRQGASVEEIVAESGWDANRVRKYEWPIIAERSHIISAAGNARISEAGAKSNSASLRERLESVTSKYNLEEVEQKWTTYQQESGQWTVSLDMVLTDQQKNALPEKFILPARWTYNPANQGLYASNDAAYFLMGHTDKKQAETDQSTPEKKPVRLEQKVDFARHAEPTPVASVAHQNSDSKGEKDEVADGAASENATLDKRSGTRDFASATERKLADLLERARRASAAESAVAPSSALQNSVPSSGQANESNTSLSANSVSQKLSQESVPLRQPSQAWHVQAAGVQNLSSQKSTTTPSVARTQDSNTESASGAQTAEKAVATVASPVESAKQESFTSAETVTADDKARKTDPEVTPSVRSERDAAGSSWRSQSKIPQVAEHEMSAENTANHQISTGSSADSASTPSAVSDTVPATNATSDETSENKENSAEDNQMAKVNRPKRASVPSWDDIIFGNQRR